MDRLSWIKRIEDDIPAWLAEAFPLARAVGDMSVGEAAAQLAALRLRLDEAVVRAAANLYEHVNPHDYSDRGSWLDAVFIWMGRPDLAKLSRDLGQRYPLPGGLDLPASGQH